MTSLPNVLIIDDDPSFCLAMSKALRRRGFSVEVVQDSDEAIVALHEATAQTVAVLDLKMPKRSGLEILQETKNYRSAPVLMLTGHGAVPEAVEAMQAGAYTFLTKPIDAADLEPMIVQAHQGVATSLDQAEFIGESRVAHQVRDVIQRLAMVSAPVLITGDTGTGKEVVARALHQQSDRADTPFIAVNMASLSRRSLEAELFGQCAWTPDQETGHLSEHIIREGLLAEVGQGTLFLDEIDELSLEHQANLLRLIEDYTYRPLDGGAPRRFSGRLIASTHRSLARLVREGMFREDLYHRLNIYPINLPPLNQRDGDALLIFKFWFQRITGSEIALDEQSIEAFGQHSWRGNAREVVNLARRAGVLCTPLNTQYAGQFKSEVKTQDVTYSQLAPLLNHQLFGDLTPLGAEENLLLVSSDSYRDQHGAPDDSPTNPRSLSPSSAVNSFDPNHGRGSDESLDPNPIQELEDSTLIGGDFSLEDVERAHILKLIHRHRNLSQVARILNVNRRTLQRKLKVWGK